MREVHDRRYLLQQTALEIFLVDGTTLFLNFSSRRVRDDIKSQILSRELPAYGGLVRECRLDLRTHTLLLRIQVC